MASPSKLLLSLEIVPGGAIILRGEDGEIMAAGTKRVVAAHLRALLDELDGKAGDAELPGVKRE